jgi:hypothetical protein
MPIEKRCVGVLTSSSLRFALPLMRAVRLMVLGVPPLVALHGRVSVWPFCGTSNAKPTSPSNFGLKSSTVPVGF